MENLQQSNIVKAMFLTMFGSPSQTTPIYRTLPQPDGAGVAGASIPLLAGIADTWGAWTQIVLAAVVTQPTLVYGIMVSAPTAAAEYQLDIGLGIAPAGVSLFAAGTAGAGIPTIEQVAAPTPGHIIHLPVPLLLNIGDNIVMRAQDSVGASTISVKLLCIEGVAGNIGLAM